MNLSRVLLVSFAMWLLVLFVVLPAVELYLLVRVGSMVGIIPTIGIILATGMLGWMLARTQGMATLRRIREETAQGRMPAVEMVSGLCILVAGLLLVTPGFVTDSIGFLLLVPPVRRRVAGALLSRFRVTVAHAGGISFQGGDPGVDSDPGAQGAGREVIDLPDHKVRTVGPAQGGGPGP